MVGRIRLIKSNGKEAVITVNKNQVLTIGRSTKCSVRINDIMLSRVHCKIWEKGGKFYVEDDGSKNGTMVDGRKIEKQEILVSRSRIELGSCKMEFQIEEVDEVKKNKPKKELKFCEKCDGSIPAADVNSGNAQEIDGKYFCKECAAAIDEEVIPKESKEKVYEFVDDDADDDAPTERVVDYDDSDTEAAPKVVMDEPALEAVEEIVEEAEVVVEEVAEEEALEVIPIEAPEEEADEGPITEIPAAQEEPAVEDSGPIDVIDFPLAGESDEDEPDKEDSGPIDVIDFNP